MLIHLLDVSIRSLFLAAIAGIMLLVLRRRQSAALSHAVWASVTFGMLLLFALGARLPRLPVRILQPSTPSAAHAFVPVPMPEAPPSFSPAAPPLRAPSPPRVRRTADWQEITLVAYLVVALLLLARLAIGLFLASRLLDRSIRVEGHPFRESAWAAVPLAVGWIRPRILLPAGWRDWDRTKLDAVLAHEDAHVRRRDALVAVAAGVNRCLFWFHPLAWWLERRLALLAEQACDDACIASLGGRAEYAQLLLDMASLVENAHGRVYKHSLAMAASTHIHQRIDSILQDGRRFSRGLSRAGWAGLVMGGLSVLLGGGSVELERQPALLPLPLPHWKPPAAPVVIAQQQPPAAPPRSVSQPAPALPPVFIPVNVGSTLGGRVRYVTGLQKENFRVFEYGVEQPVTQFLDANQPVSLAVIYDTSSGLLNYARRRLGAAYSLDRLMQRAVLPLTSQTLFTNLNAEDEFLPSSGTEGNLLDELRMTMQAMAGAKNSHKAIVVETDGSDRASYALDEIASLAREANIPIFSVGTLVTYDGTHSTELSATPLLRELADRTGGQYYTANDPDEMSDILLQIGNEIRYQYILGYNPSRQGRSSGYRNVEVRLEPPTGMPALSVHSRTGYYVP